MRKDDLIFFLFFLLFSPVFSLHAYAQVAVDGTGQCDPLNIDMTDLYEGDPSVEYPSLESVCTNGLPPQPKQPNCSEVGADIVYYDDAVLLSDNETVQVVSTAQDLSAYASLAMVQIRASLTLPDGVTVMPFGAYATRGGYTMASKTVVLPSDSTLPSTYTLSSQHEFNWRGCDGDGTILLTTFQFELAHTKTATNFSDPETNTVQGADGTVYCGQNNWCTPETTPPICLPSYVKQRPLLAGTSASCVNYYNTLWFAERSSSSSPWICIPVIPGDNANGTSDSSKGVCTK